MLRSKLITTLFPLALVTFVAMAAMALTAPAASAAGPWWHLDVSSRPTSLEAGVARDEVQELEVAATGGEVAVYEPNSLEEAERTGNLAELKYGCFKYDGSDAEAQSAIEGAYGADDVEVNGGPGDASGGKPYEVTFVSGLADRAVPLMATAFPVCQLVGHESLAGRATVTEKVKGRSDGQIVLVASNLGDSSIDGETEPVKIADELPPGLEPSGVEGFVDGEGGSSQHVSCEAGSQSCSYEGTLAPYETIEVRVGVNVKEGAASGEEDEATVSGGGAATVTAGQKLTIGGDGAFGVQGYELTPEEEGGALDTQAGSHPFQLTTTLTLDQTGEAEPVAMAKDLEFYLPPGLIGNPTPFPQCTIKQFLTTLAVANECPAETAVGVANVSYKLGKQVQIVSTPLFNLEPERGEPARFGFYAAVVPVMLNTSVRTGGDYGVTVSVHNINQIAGFLSSQVTFWGVPGDARHNNVRGSYCLLQTHGETLPAGDECQATAQKSPPPLLSLPSSCSGSLQSSTEADSWQRPGAFQLFALTTPMPALDGCNRLPFSSEVSVAPDVPDASTSTGLSVDVRVPQTAAFNPEGLAASTLKDTTLALPAGVTLNPGGADGLEACDEGEIGYLGHEATGEDATAAFSATLSQPFCPNASKLGTVEIQTPLLPNPLKGAVYLATPAPAGEAGQNPFKSLVAMYIVAEDPVSGTLVKLPGQVTPCEEVGEQVDGVACEAPGQLISTFEDTPQLPFENLVLHFFGGGRAPLATPGLCGSYTTKAVFTPWSGSARVTSTSTFNITSGPNGTACPSSPKPFTPEFSAGNTNNQAGGYSELLTTMGHPDEDQPLGALSITLPEGLTGSLSKVKLCGEPQAAEGTCGPESLIGHTTVTAGLGSTPAVVARPGEVYITGPYNGHGSCKVGEAGCAPFGLSIANPAETGPFDLEKGTPCDCIVVRAKVEVNPITTQLTISSSQLPTILKGIPLDLQHVQVAISRPEFMVNPTSCEKMKIEGSLASSEGASAAISEPFQAANCASLAFKPSFSASTSAKSSREDGASLHVAIAYPKGSQGSQADIREAKVELPKALPSELKTLQKACLAAVFEANPAGCPKESVVGQAKANTPILPVSLEGPAYFVSYGGAKFPELVLVLQGDGVTIDLHGETFISKAGVTSSTFKTVPDDPVESFELTLPEREYSALGAPGGKLCSKKLVMPTYMVGQNGATFQQQTKIEVQGCADAITLVSHKVKKGKLTLKVSVPAAGKLTVSGKGVKSTIKKASGRETLSLTLELPKIKKTGKRKHPHETKAKVKLKLAFKPSAKKAKKLVKTMTLHYKR